MTKVDALEPALALIRATLARIADRPAIVGICGAQGSGKSTLAEALAVEVPGTAVISIDDLYLSRADRDGLAKAVHPLLRTRGVPGTHDIALGLDVLDAIAAGQPVALPRFDKARDDRAPVADWPRAEPGIRLVILEGWCVGAKPQDAAALAQPVNQLERESDPDGTWRNYVNGCLAGNYQTLFSRIDALILLAAPDFEAVLGWRIEQERSLRERSPANAAGLMSDAQIEDFIAHYERLTRSILDEMPHRADLTLWLDRSRRVVSVD